MRPGQVKLGRFQFGQSIIYNLELSVPAVLVILTSFRW
jgi:hypothetical membrane protein